MDSNLNKEPIAERELDWIWRLITAVTLARQGGRLPPADEGGEECCRFTKLALTIRDEVRAEVLEAMKACEE